MAWRSERERLHALLLLAFLCLPAVVRASSQGDPLPVDVTQARITLHSSSNLERDALVTFGIPFPPGALRDAGNLRIVDEEGNEIPAHVEATLRWHSAGGGIRAVRVQLRVSMKDASRRLRFTTGTKRSNDIEGWPYSEGLVDAANQLRMPDVLATLDPEWMTRSLLAGPQVPLSADNAYDTYIGTQFEWAGTLPATDSTAWLFDRPSTLFKL